ncbi:hypothetical protein [Kitasatospora sp. NPDC085464]|uniref:hypothetical protein n=1 Tax=Kitasatospora sp. NPDC085464 TaxID=3364063 RepID=UPI0037C7F477
MPVNLAKAEPEPTATLIISRNSSRCSNCRRTALADQTIHDVIPGWGEPRPGCGARFTATTTDSPGMITPARLKAQRPDLPVKDDQPETARTSLNPGDRAAWRMLRRTDSEQ